jgi:hypothetical protein
VPPFALVGLERFEPLASLGLACLVVIGPTRLAAKVELLLCSERGALLGTDRILQPLSVLVQREETRDASTSSVQAERPQYARPRTREDVEPRHPGSTLVREQPAPDRRLAQSGQRGTLALHRLDGGSESVVAVVDEPVGVLDQTCAVALDVACAFFEDPVDGEHEPVRLAFGGLVLGLELGDAGLGSGALLAAKRCRGSTRDVGSPRPR